MADEVGNMSNVENNINVIIENILQYQPGAPIDTVKKAFQLAETAHTGQLRVSGEKIGRAHV